MTLTSYFVTGTLAVFASWMFSGCRFGNHVDETAAVEPFTYYAMQPKHLFVCVDIKGETKSRCAETTLDKISEWKAYLTHPIIFYRPDPSVTGAYLVSKDLKKSLSISLDSLSAATFTHYSYSSPVAVFHHTECVDQMVNYAEGVYRPSAQAAIEGHPIAGRMELVIQTERAITGSCDQSLAEMQDCYEDTSEDKSACGLSTPQKNQTEHDWVVSYFEPYIDRGLMTPTDITSVTKVYYQFIYD
jgi:hypothetical protein